MASTIFTCNDVSIRVNSENPDIIKYLNDMFGNYYSDTPKKIDYNIDSLIGVPTFYTSVDKENNDFSDNYISGDSEKLYVYLPYFDKTKESFVKRIFTTTAVKVFEKKVTLLSMALVP